MPFAFKSNPMQRLKSEWVSVSNLKPTDKIICISNQYPQPNQFLCYQHQFLLNFEDLNNLEHVEPDLLVLGEFTHNRILILQSKIFEPTQSDYQWFDLRNLTLNFNINISSMAASASALTHWHQQNKYCGHCGHKTTLGKEHSRICSNNHCKNTVFPRIDPAVIMSVINEEDEILLGRQASWDKNRYSVIAGFLSHGETLEQCVAREVKEETGVSINGCSYMASQPWPFPGSIMLGFRATATKQSIILADHELENAFWISRGELQKQRQLEQIKLSPKLSISRYLIDDWLHQ